MGFPGHGSQVNTENADCPLEQVSSCRNVPEHHDPLDLGRLPFQLGHVLDANLICEALQDMLEHGVMTRELKSFRFSDFGLLSGFGFRSSDFKPKHLPRRLIGMA